MRGAEHCMKRLYHAYGIAQHAVHRAEAAGERREGDAARALPAAVMAIEAARGDARVAAGRAIQADEGQRADVHRSWHSPFQVPALKRARPSQAAA